MGAITRSISNNLTTGLGAGLVKQVVTATHATQVNSTSTSFADTGLTCNITPSATSSKILVIVQQQLISDRDQSDCYSRLRLLRASIFSFKSLYVAVSFISSKIFKTFQLN